MPIIRVIDFETSDFPPDGEVIEVGLCDLSRPTSDNIWEVSPPTSWLCGTDKPSTPSARAAHHISPAEVAGLPKFESSDIWDSVIMDGVTAVAAQNSAFDSQFWGVCPVPVICTYKAALRVWPEAPGHSNGVLRYWLEDQDALSLDHELAMPPHRAGADAYVTAHLLKALLEGGATGREMAIWTKEPRLLPTCPIGKFRGKPWREVETGFLRWMLNQADMEADLKWNASRELEQRRA